MFGQTPESLLQRNDSKNPATTCKGITSAGRPCRRSLAARSVATGGVVAIATVAGSDAADAAAFFCWQHKDQAEKLAAQTSSSGQGGTRILPLLERTSIDTLVAKLGVLDVVDEEPEPSSTPRDLRRHADWHADHHPTRSGSVKRPPSWDTVRGPVMAVPKDASPASSQHAPGRHAQQRRPKQKQKSLSLWRVLCCAGHADDDDHVEIARHKRRVRDTREPEMSQRRSQQQKTYPDPVSQSGGHRTKPIVGDGPTRDRTPVMDDSRRSAPPLPGDSASSGTHNTSAKHDARPRPHDTQRTSASLRVPLAGRPAQFPSTRSPPSGTSQLLSWIPQALPPRTTSLLLAELAKPISAHDEAGYIYIFWLTDADDAAPSAGDAASLLLTPPPRASNGRRQRDVLRTLSGSSGGSSGREEEGSPDSPATKRTILLKIGRASNVHRRMGEWTRQCGYNLSLARFYPHVASPPSPAAGVRRVPHARRVERLVHLELADRRVRRDCGVCGKEHREWFEVEASREGVRGVDEVVRRWVRWSEGVGAGE